MKLIAAFLILGFTPMASSQTDETVVWVEPDFNPLWAQVGRAFTATCQAQADQRTSLEWIINGGLPDASGFTVVSSHKTLGSGKVRTSSVLSKDPIGFEDFNVGGLMCRATTGDVDTESFVGFQLFTVQTEHPNITEGEDVSLKCVPDMPARVVWSRDGQVIDNSTERRVLEDDSRTLVIQNSRPQDSGMYQCTLFFVGGYNDTTNRPKEQSFVQNIPLSAKPYMREKASLRVETLINDTLSLVCPVAAYPPPEIYWLRDDDSPVKKSARVRLAPYRGVQDASLTVSEVVKEDLGVYVCVAENSVGRLVKKFRVGLVGGASFDHAHASVWSVLIGLCVALVISMLK